MAQETLRFDLTATSRADMQTRAQAVANTYFGATQHSLEVEFGSVRTSGEDPLSEERPFHATFVAVGTFA